MSKDRTKEPLKYYDYNSIKTNYFFKYEIKSQNLYRILKKKNKDFISFLSSGRLAV